MLLVWLDVHCCLITLILQGVVEHDFRAVFPKFSKLVSSVLVPPFICLSSSLGSSWTLGNVLWFEPMYLFVPAQIYVIGCLFLHMLIKFSHIS